MKEKKTIRQSMKEWWEKHKEVVTTGVICGLVGLGYGFVKGVTTTVGMVVREELSYEPDVANVVDSENPENTESNGTVTLRFKGV